MKTKTFTITNLAEYITQTESIVKKWTADEDYFIPWFRGQSNAQWKLIPSIYRIKGGRENEESYRRDFMLKAFPYLNPQFPLPVNDWEWYFLMQHYGLPTRLLDWSESSLIGLYFALRDNNAKSDGAVWVLNPWKLNSRVKGIGSFILRYSEKKLAPYLPDIYSGDALPENPVALQPIIKSQRINAQRGCFTIHGKYGGGIDEYKADNHLIKIVIPANKINLMRTQLNLAGITETSIYPDLAGLCKELLDNWKPVEIE